MSKYKKIILPASVLVVFFLFLAFHVLLSNATVNLSSEEKEWISQNKQKVFYIGYSNLLNEELYVKKLCEIISDDTGLNIQPYKDSWDNIKHLFQDESLPIMSMLNTEEESDYISITKSFISLNAGLYSRMSNAIDSYEKIKTKRIGVLKNFKLLTEFKREYKDVAFMVFKF